MLGIAKFFKGVAEGVAAPIADVMVKREETRQVAAGLQSKLDLTDQELALVRTDVSRTSWKDEYVVLWVTGGITVLCIMVFLGYDIQPILDLLDVWVVQWLLVGVVGASLGIKGLDKVRGR